VWRCSRTGAVAVGSHELVVVLDVMVAAAVEARPAAAVTCLRTASSSADRRVGERRERSGKAPPRPVEAARQGRLEDVKKVLTGSDRFACPTPVDA